MKAIIIGSGRMAAAVLFDVVKNKRFEAVTVADADPERAAALAASRGGGIATPRKLDAGDEGAARELIAGHAVCISAVPYRYNLTLARAAVAVGAHAVDMGGNNDVVAAELRLDEDARRAGVALVPDMGLAPGLVSVLTSALAEKIYELDEVHLRVGGLPRDKGTPFGYGLVFSPAGLINEYAEPCLVIRDGRLHSVPALTGLEELDIEPLGKLEAFHTSGGASSLPHAYLGLARELDYKTIRYPGHCDWIRPFFDLGFASQEEVSIGSCRVRPRDVFIERLVSTLPECRDDVVVLRCWGKGRTGGENVTVTYELVDYADAETGLTAMMRCTGFPVAVTAHAAAAGKIKPGAHAPEAAVAPTPFIEELRARGLSIRERTA